MKKYVMFTMLIAMMVCLLALPGHLQATPDVSVKVDGQYVSFPDQKPYIDSANRTMVPVRAPMEKMGCTVEWNDKTRQATITKGDKTAVFTIDKNTYTVNGQTKTMDTKAVITNNRTAFPIRFAAEAMGANVEWDQDTYTVLITTGNNAKPGLVLLETTGLPDYVDPEFPNYQTTIPFTSAKGTEILALEYRDGDIKIVIGKNPVERMQLYTDFGGGGVTVINDKYYYEVPRGYESEIKGPENPELLKQFDTLKLFIPQDGLYEFPNPFK